MQALIECLEQVILCAMIGLQLFLPLLATVSPMTGIYMVPGCLQ